MPFSGDIKCENVLVTSWNWLYLADFASFKPTYIPYDDPSDFSFFYDTGGRRLCYLAPEVWFLTFLNFLPFTFFAFLNLGDRYLSQCSLLRKAVRITYLGMHTA